MKRIKLLLKKYAHTLTYSCLLCFLFFASNQIIAQVGINNTDPKASLDIRATDPSDPIITDGLLVPRVSTFPTSNPDSDQDGMLLYLTTTVGSNTPGFYYWNHVTSTWLKFTDSSADSSDADFFEEGTTSAPNDINDDIFTQGNVAIGKNTADYPIDILSNTSEIGANVLLGGTNNLGRSGFYTNITNSGNGFQYGIFNEMAGTGTGRKYGVHNVFDVLSNSLQIGVNTEITNDGAGSKYGVRNILNGASNAGRYGVYNDVESTGFGVLNGVSNHMGGTGNGARRGTYNSFSGSGSGEHIGTYNQMNSSGTGNLYGIHNQISTTTNLSTYGLYSLIFGGSNGRQYGEYLDIGTIGNGIHYGNYLYLRGTGTGNKYGSYILIHDGAGGSHYGVYSEVLKPGGFAGYFLGNVSIGTTNGNKYIFPASRGDNNQIMQTDGSGNVSWVDVSNQDMEDADGDTKVQVDEGSIDEDKIRFDLKGTEYVVMEENANGHLRIDIKDSKSNILIGYNAGIVNGLGATNSSEARDNIALGASSLQFNETGSYNTAVGILSLQENESGIANVAIGNSALKSTNSDANVAIGFQAAVSHSSGNSNVVIGSLADGFNTSGSANVIIGRDAGSGISSHSKSGSVMIGHYAGFYETNSNRLYIDNTNANQNNALLYGEFGTDNTTTGNTFRVNGKLQLGTTVSGRYELPSLDGSINQVMQTDGSGNVAWVDDSSIGIEKINDLIDGKSDNDGSGDGSSIFLGINAGLADDFTDNKNTSVGYSSLASNVNGVNNIAIGYNSLIRMASGNSNTAIGAFAMNNTTSANGNVAIGLSTLQNSSGSANNALGVYALEANTVGNYNNAFGKVALNHNVDGIDNNAFGYYALYQNVSGNYNNAFGNLALEKNKGSSNNAFGSSSLRLNTVGIRNSAYGGLSLTSNFTGNYNNSFGFNSSEKNQSGSNNSAFGAYSMQENIAGNYNVAFGNESGQYALGNNNVFLGALAGKGSSNHTISGSVMIGYSAGLNELNSNKLYIENSSAGANNALIYGEFNNNILRINGELQLGLTSADRYAFPTADGTSNQILQTNGSGQLSWADGSGLLSASNGLSVSGGDIILGGSLTQLTTITHGANNIIYNLNSTGRFKIQDAGVDVFEVRNNGSSYFGNDTYWKDVNTAGVNLAALVDDGDDGRFILYEDGSASVDLDANTSFTFNEQGLDRDFRIEGDSETNLFRIDAANNRIGIMDSTPNFDIHLKQSTNTQGGSGGIGFESSSTTNNWKVYHSGSNFSFSENGVRRAYITAGTGAYVPTSDRRLKKSITEVESILNKVNNLKAYRYLYKDQDFSAKKTIGFMAQEVLPLFPELVEKAEDGYYGLNYAGFGVVAVKAIQEQQEEIEALKSENELLKEKQKSLELRLQKIELLVMNKN